MTDMKMPRMNADIWINLKRKMSLRLEEWNEILETGEPVEKKDLDAIHLETTVPATRFKLGILVLFIQFPTIIIKKRKLF